jgi:alpha-glucosidase (family GH31 glycosyl hydrolase)
MKMKSSPLTSAAASLAVFGLSAAVALGATIQFGGVPDVLTISQVSDHAVRIALTPLDEAGKPRPERPIYGFVDFPKTEKLNVRELTENKTVEAGDLRVTVQPEPLTISVHRKDGSLVQELKFNNDGGSNSITFPMAGPLLGLGEGGPQYDRRKQTYRVQNGEGSPLLATDGAQILVPYLLGTEGWALFVAQPRVEFDLRGDNGAINFQAPVSTNATPAAGAGRGRGGNRGTAAESATNGVDLYVVDAHDPDVAMKEYIRLTGAPAMPPKWALGYQQSHRTLGTEADLLAEAKRFRDDKLPIDTVIYLGTGFCTNGWNFGHDSFAFNTNVFTDDAKTAIGKLHDDHLHVVLHIVPLQRDYPSLHDTIPPTPGENVDKTDIGSYWARHLPLFFAGIDGWWPDEGDWLDVPSRLERLRMYYEGPISARPNVRPWDLQRNGYMGMSKFGGWYWSGDIVSTWHTFSEQVKVGINTSLSLSPFWGTDIGGFYPDRVGSYTGELYTRWFEFAAFCPLFRSHGRTWQLHSPVGWDTGKTGPVESPGPPPESELHNAAVEPACKKYLELRYQLLPYNYTLTREACDTGMPMIRSLWLQYPQDKEAVATGDEYLWGANMLIAPVVEKGATSRHVYLPEGTWYDWWTGEKVEGKKAVDKAVDLATMPIYTKAGSIIPLDPVRQYTDEAVTSPTTLQVYPGADGTFVLYDDDGNSLDYSKGTDAKTVWIKMHWDDKAHKLTLESDPRMKKWPGAARTFAVKVVGGSGAAKQIQFSGSSVTTQL